MSNVNHDPQNGHRKEDQGKGPGDQGSGRGLKSIREIAKKYTPEQIESCIITQLGTGKNVCLMDDAHEKIINSLAKAAYVKTLMTEQDLSLADALRELARKMRRIQSHSRDHAGEKAARDPSGLSY